MTVALTFVAPRGAARPEQCTAARFAVPPGDTYGCMDLRPPLVLLALLGSPAARGDGDDAD